MREKLEEISFIGRRPKSIDYLIRPYLESLLANF